ncbi:MAG TPA: hypothetical protein VLV46_07500 [Gaiellaceae bacterium]|nr:hypothetical protein [Gaiellaceae bacterium]
MPERGARTTRARLCGVIALLSLVAASAASAAGAATFSVRPGHYSAADPATKAYFKRQVGRGGSFSDDVVVSNGAAAPLTLYVYPVDGLTGQTSGSVYANRGRPRRKAGAWIHTSVSRITIPAHATAAVHFTAVVPAKAVPGDHLAGIAFQDAHVITSKGKFRVRQILREVVGVLIRVPGPARARLRLGPMGLRTIPGTPYGSVVVGIANVGRLLCKPSLSITLTSSGRRMHLTRRLDTVLPGDRIAYPLILRHALEPSTYVIHGAASCAASKTTKSTRVVLGARLVGTADKQPPTAVAAPVTGHSSSTPWGAIGLVGLGALGAGIGLGWFLRPRRPAS